ncbi:MAG TPA: sigma-70 family RNA polymerase sigma factor [Sporichthyaceae bacterium]|jgi:RNA polymerase sigma-70 factor (ECF subfamily)
MTRVVDRTDDLAIECEEYRVGLTGYCYRMLGSAAEAEDAVQEAMLRAWRARESLTERPALKSWLYKIATNVCFDLLTARQRRARPMDLGPSSYARAPLREPTAESMWVTPAPDLRVLADHGDPAEIAEARESVRLAFVATLQLLPPRQRAVLILREVLRWSAAEVAALLETTAASVNSLLQRARATLDRWPTDTAVLAPADDEQRELLERYVAAFTSYDMDALVALLHAEATMSMPPFPLWLRGGEQIREWLTTRGKSCADSRIEAIAANGSPAWAQWRRDPDGVYRPWAIQVVEIRDGAIVGLNFFLDTLELWPLFGLRETPD